MPLSELAKRLAVLRRGTDETQGQVAAACYMSDKAYQSYERGRRKPPEDAMVALARHFGVTVGQLLGCEELVTNKPHIRSVDRKVDGRSARNPSSPHSNGEDEGRTTPDMDERYDRLLEKYEARIEEVGRLKERVATLEEQLRAHEEPSEGGGPGA